MPSVKQRAFPAQDAEAAQLLEETPSSRSLQDRAARGNTALCVSVSFGAVLLTVLAVALWGHTSSPKLDDQEVETFYKFKFGQVADLLNWEKGVVDLCTYSHDLDVQEVVTLPAATIEPRGNVCQGKEIAHAFPCNWTHKWHCPNWEISSGHDSEDDGGIGYHCCCEVSRSRQKTQSAYPFLSEQSAAPAPQHVRIKVISYNLEWWKIYGRNHGNGGSEGGVLASSHAAEPIDFIAFQECGDKDRVLADAGLLKSFVTFGAPYQKCAAVRKDAWRWLDQGHQEVAADVYWNNFGKRGVMWVRLWHKPSGLRVFLANFHGPLAINSGGACGGKRTARNLLRVIKQHSEPGDVIILLGDFNANSASQTVQELRKSLVHVQSGHVLGGIDHCFVNLPPYTVKAIQDLGDGGSDHHAVMTVFEVDTGGGYHWQQLKQNPDLGAAIIAELRKDFPKDDWKDFWCGLEEMNVSYNPVGRGSSWVVDWTDVPTTDWCCRHCQRERDCKAFRFEGIPGSKKTRCTLMGPSWQRGAKNASYLTVASGLPADVAIQELQSSFATGNVYLD